MEEHVCPGVLKANAVEHPLRRLRNPYPVISTPWEERRPLDHHAAETRKIDEIRELLAKAERPGRRKHRRPHRDARNIGAEQRVIPCPGTMRHFRTPPRQRTRGRPCRPCGVRCSYPRHRKGMPRGRTPCGAPTTPHRAAQRTPPSERRAPS